MQLDLQLTVESNEAVQYTIFTTEWTIQVCCLRTLLFVNIGAKIVRFFRP
jgi:hypothetical protein